MIKANELRIGNYLLSDSGEMLKIEGIKLNDYDSDKDCIKVYSIDKWIQLDGFLPIPLTEQLSLDLGFRSTDIKWKDGSITRECFQIKRKWIIEFTKEGILFSLFLGLQHNPVFLTRICHVHELQNICFSLGEELIYNPKQP